MPKIGEIKRGRNIGKNQRNTNYVWLACEICGKTRWVRLLRGNPENKVCHKCSGLNLKYGYQRDQNPNWKGGKHKDADGYIRVLASSDYASHSGTKYVLEHRLIMGQELGRYLFPWEHVHHKNGIRDDNRIENLQLISPAQHSLYSEPCGQCQLRKEIRLLRLQIKMLQEQLQGGLPCHETITT